MNTMNIRGGMAKKLKSCPVTVGFDRQGMKSATRISN